MELVQLIVQKKWNGRKRSETVGNMIRPKLVQPAFLKKKHFRATQFFFWRSKGVQGETVGNSRRSHLRSATFPTVSDRLRPFHFFWTINWTNSIYGRLIQCKPVQTMTLKFFRATLVRVHCTKYIQILHLDLDIQYSLKITKSQELVKFNSSYGWWSLSVFFNSSRFSNTTTWILPWC